MPLPDEVREHSALRCSYIWRSIGTHIWFEYGVPEIKLLNNGRRSVYGELTLHIVSDNWRLLVDGQCPLNSDTVTNENFKACGPRWFLNNPIPEIVEVGDEKCELKFSNSTSIFVYPDSSEDIEDELSIKLPDGSYWAFKFGKGWFLSS